MDIEVFVLCDAATEMLGKLNVLGTFDTITAGALPAVHPHCALALRMRFSQVEVGKHSVRINIVDADGRPVLPSLDGGLSVAMGPSEQSAITNLVLNIDRLKFDKAGQYSVDLAIDGREERSLPIFVRLREPPATQN